MMFPVYLSQFLADKNDLNTIGKLQLSRFLLEWFGKTRTSSQTGKWQILLNSFKYVRIASILFFYGTFLPVYMIPMVLGAYNIALYTLYSLFFIIILT
jgi:hypothetical protein